MTYEELSQDNRPSRDLQAKRRRRAVAPMFPGDLLQHPARPVQNEMNRKMKDTMKRPTIVLIISGKKNFLKFGIFLFW